MPPGYGAGRPPHRELRADPIEVEEPEVIERRTVPVETVFSAGHSLPRKTPSSIPQYAPPDSEEVPIPYSNPRIDPGRTKRQRSVLGGCIGPTNTLRSSAVYGRRGGPNTSKRSRDASEFERITSPVHRARRPPEPPSVITDDGGPEGGPELGGGQKRARLKAKADDAEPVTPNKTAGSPSRFPRTPALKTRGIDRRPLLPFRKAVAKGSLLSVDSDRKRNKKKNWPLHNFKWGLEEYDSEDLRLEGLTDGDFRVLGGGDDGVGCLKKFSVDSIRKPFFCGKEGSFGFTFIGTGPNHAYLLLAQPEDAPALCEILNPEEVEPECMAGHLSSIEEWRMRRQRLETPANPPPPTETKRLPADGGRGRASRTGGVESRTPAPARNESNTVRLREPPQIRNTRSGRLSSTQAVECTPPASPDHLKHRARELPPKWNQPLLYPFEGTKRANVDFKDLTRLNPTEFLNDNIINFYLRFLEEGLKQENPSLHRETHFFNTFFYERLSMKGDKLRNMEGVSKWTAKIDLFEKKYIIVPINECSHWYLAIICNLPNLERKLGSAGAASNSTVTADTDIGDKGSPPALATNGHQPVIDLGGQSGEMAKASDKDRDISETRNSLQNMSVDQESDEENEWPEVDENQQRDPKLAKKNRYSLIKKGSNDDEDIEMTDASFSTKETTAKTKVRRKNPHFQSPNTPAIIILDSMGSRRAATVTRLREWLVFEARNKRSLEIPKDALKSSHPKAPNQDNWHDCGVYMLHYIEIFLAHRQALVASFLARDNSLESATIWRGGDIKGMRTKLFDLICRLHKEYDAKYPVVRAKSQPGAQGQPRAKAEEQTEESPSSAEGDSVEGDNDEDQDDDDNGDGDGDGDENDDAAVDRVVSSSDEGIESPEKQIIQEAARAEAQDGMDLDSQDGEGSETGGEGHRIAQSFGNYRRNPSTRSVRPPHSPAL